MKKREKTGRPLTKTEQSLRPDYKLITKNKLDPKTPNYTLLKVMGSTEIPNEYVIILDIPEKNADFREGAKYKVHPPRHASHLAPLETTCISILRNDPKEKDKVTLAFNTHKQPRTRQTMDIYLTHCNEKGIHSLAIEEMPNTAQEIKEK